MVWVNIHLPVAVLGIPRGARKERLILAATSEHIEIPEVDPVEAPLAARFEVQGEAVVVRYFDQELFIEIGERPAAEQVIPFNSTNRTGLFKNSRLGEMLFKTLPEDFESNFWYDWNTHDPKENFVEIDQLRLRSYDRDARSSQRSEYAEILEKFLIIGDGLYRKIEEPFLAVCRGLHHTAHIVVAMDWETRPSSTFGCYSLGDYEQALDLAVGAGLTKWQRIRNPVAFLQPEMFQQGFKSHRQALLCQSFGQSFDDMMRMSPLSAIDYFLALNEDERANLKTIRFALEMLENDPTHECGQKFWDLIVNAESGPLTQPIFDASPFLAAKVAHFQKDAISIGDIEITASAA